MYVALNNVAKNKYQWLGATVLVHNVKAYVGVEFWLYSLLTSALFGGEWIPSRPHRLVVPRAGLQYLQNI
jgi:hypothetical protein